MRRFRFRLARLLDIRERVEEERRATLGAAREALARACAEHSRLERERTGVMVRLADVDRPGASAARHDLLLYQKHLEQCIVAAVGEIAARRREETEAIAALQSAVRDRKVLGQLRERRRQEHRKETDRLEQIESDESAARSSRNSFPGAAEEVSPPKPRK